MRVSAAVTKVEDLISCISMLEIMVKEILSHLGTNLLLTSFLFLGIIIYIIYLTSMWRDHAITILLEFVIEVLHIPGFSSQFNDWPKKMTKTHLYSRRDFTRRDAAFLKGCLGF